MGNGMIEWGMLSRLLGGLGLFLLGMGMMTDGLKLAAGPALHRILSSATRTRWHALGSGALELFQGSTFRYTGTGTETISLSAQCGFR